MKKPVIYAHRGASSVAPENTLASFKKALAVGADGIELDVHLTADGHMVVIHDEKVDRTSNGKGWVKAMSLAGLRELDFGCWFSPQFKDERIPTLEEVLTLLEGWNGILNIELKSGPIIYKGLERKVLDLIKSRNMLERTIISSFNHYSLLDVKKLEPKAKIGLLYAAGLVNPWDYAKMLGAYAIHPLFYGVVPEIIEGCKKNGIAINPYTVDQPEFIKNFALAGVDGIITNVPETALRVLAETGVDN